MRRVQAQLERTAAVASQDSQPDVWGYLLGLSPERSVPCSSSDFGGWPLFSWPWHLVIMAERTSAQFVRQSVKVGIPVDLDGHLGRVADDVAVVAPLKMVFQFSLGLGSMVLSR